MSDTTELFTGSSGVPEESPGYSGPSGLSATAGAGTAAGAPAGPAAGETVTDKPARRGGSGLSGMLLADLQRLAQSMGITGTGRLRKSQLIEAIQSKQGGGGAAPSAPGGVSAGPSAGNGSGTLDNSVQRGASAGAGAPRQREQDAMESDTTTQPALGNAAQSSGPAQEADTTTREARRGGSRDTAQAGATGQGAQANGADGQLAFAAGGGGRRVCHRGRPGRQRSR